MSYTNQELKIDTKACVQKGCGAAPAWRPRFLVWAKGYDPRSTSPAAMELGIAFCDVHMAEIEAKPSLLTDDAGWLKICSILRAMGKADPDRETLRLERVHLSDPKSGRA